MPIPSWSEKQRGWSSHYVEPAIRAPVHEIRTLLFLFKRKIGSLMWMTKTRQPSDLHTQRRQVRPIVQVGCPSMFDCKFN